MESFFNKDVEEAWQYLDAFIENSQPWEIEDASEMSQPISICATKDWLIELGETKDIMVRSITPIRKVDLLTKRPEITNYR